MARRVLGDEVIGAIADSPSLPRASLSAAVDVARSFGVEVEVIQTDEMDNPDYASNPLNRCYFCKAELFAKLDELAQSRGYRAIAYGENADDSAALRPGSRAAAEFAVIAPLRMAGFTKADVRTLSRQLGLPTADAPAQPCLSSRIPHGTPVTREALGFVERGEACVRAFGFRVFRVRYVDGQPPTARVQIAPAEMDRLESIQGQLERDLLAVGFRGVEFDAGGYVGIGA